MAGYELVSIVWHQQWSPNRPQLRPRRARSHDRLEGDHGHARQGRRARRRANARRHQSLGPKTPMGTVSEQARRHAPRRQAYRFSRVTPQGVSVPPCPPGAPMGKGGARAALDSRCRVQGAVSAPPPSCPAV